MWQVQRSCSKCGFPSVRFRVQGSESGSGFRDQSQAWIEVCRPPIRASPSPQSRSSLAIHPPYNPPLEYVYTRLLISVHDSMSFPPALPFLRHSPSYSRTPLRPDSPTSSRTPSRTPFPPALPFLQQNSSDCLYVYGAAAHRMQFRTGGIGGIWRGWARSHSRACIVYLSLPPIPLAAVNMVTVRAPCSDGHPS